MGRDADPVLNRFKEACLPRLKALYRPRLVLAFGSRVRGDALDSSDLDVVIVSEAFRGLSFLERAEKVLAEIDPPFAVDLLCYSPEEFDAKREELGIVSLALEEGVALSLDPAP
jgi:predicted nucleotidyltransferase